MHFSEFQAAQRVLIYGFGIEGQSSFQFLTQQFPQKIVHMYDKNPQYIDHPQFQSLPLDDYDIIVVSPGVDRYSFSKSQQKKLTGQCDIFFANITEPQRQKIIGITGTKGKSTTTKFCLDLLTRWGKSVVASGNYGNPLLDIYRDFQNNQYDYVVCELSSYQLQHLQSSPHIALFLNIYPEHLERHHGYEGYKEAKSRLWQFQSETDIVFVQEKFCDFVQNTPQTCICASAVDASFFPEKSIFRANHFLENFGLVWELAQYLGIEKEVFTQTAQTFVGLEHRLEFVAEKNGVQFFNDSISTNIYSAARALEYFAHTLGFLIIGGQNKDGEYELLYQALQKYCPNAWVGVLQSDVSHSIQSVFEHHQFTQFSLVSSLDEAVRLSVTKTPFGKVCLLSPSAKSFDGFRDYKHRGEVFKQSVYAL